VINFVNKLVGTLVRLEEDADSRFRYEVWFDYTREAMNLIREGAMLAVPNFASSATEQHLSILEVISILPMHYALGNDTSGFPGFVVEAAKSLVSDWEEQESESTEDTTKIRCIAIPTNFEAFMRRDTAILQEERNLPMLGAPTRLLDTDSTRYVVNYGVRAEENVIEPGVLIRDDKVSIQVRVEDLLKTHFGIFGFTGAGKSNLLSTLISRVLTESQEKVKIVFFDLMGEYTTLLIDQLLRKDLEGRLVCLGENTLPGPVFKFINEEQNGNLNDAMRSLSRYTLLPKALKPHSAQMAKGLEALLQGKHIKVFNEIENLTLYNIFFDPANPKSPAKFKDRRTGNFTKRNDLLKDFVRKHGGTNCQLTAALAQTLLQDLRREVGREGKLQEFKDDLGGVIGLLEEAEEKLKKQLRCAISLKETIGLLNDKDKSSLLIFNAHDPNALRTFAKRLGDEMYESRRRSGEIEPLVSFIFDEADEFIPQQAAGSYEASAEIVKTLARRGRKFGLGIGIATQRIRYLDTSIMAQPHTYFVSKMPRLSDRQVVAEAFGVPEDMFRQAFKFRKGDWLLMSYDATGLEAIPIPIHCEDANQRIKRFLDEISRKRGD
jgi:hypothetical protein